MNEERDGEENGGLGELSEGLFKEHEGRWPQESETPLFRPGKDVPPDISYQQSVLTETNFSSQQAIAAPVQRQTVQSVFDVRPINARDFIATASAEMQATYDLETMLRIDTVNDSDPAITTFTVPEGYVALIRGFKFSIVDYTKTLNNNYNDQGPGTTYIEAAFISIAQGLAGPEVSLKIDNTVVPNYTLMDNLGFFIDDFQECYVLVDAGETFQLSVRCPAALDLPVYATSPASNQMLYNVTSVIKGNLLLKTGVPARYEVGTRL